MVKYCIFHCNNWMKCVESTWILFELRVVWKSDAVVQYLCTVYKSIEIHDHADLMHTHIAAPRTQTHSNTNTHTPNRYVSKVLASTYTQRLEHLVEQHYVSIHLLHSIVKNFIAFQTRLISEVDRRKFILFDSRKNWCAKDEAFFMFSTLLH